MARQSRWAAVRFKILVAVNGIQFEAVQVVTSFEINTIPTCSITVAVGRDVKTLQAAAAHKHIGKLKNRNYVEIYLYPEPLGQEGGAPNEWPKKIPFFFGYVTGTGWQRATSGASFTIHCEHWLSELNYTSAINGASHPGNPAAYTYPAGHKTPARAAGGDTAVGWLYHLLLEGGVDSNMAKADVWENILKPWSIQSAKMPPVDLRLRGMETPSGNDGALEILEGKGDFKIVSEKMQMAVDGPDSLALGNSLSRALESSMMNNAINTTLWAKIVGEWSPQFWFSVVPRVEDTLIVPFVGALGPNKEFLEIKAGDYVQCDLHAQIPQQLAAIGLSHAIENLAGGIEAFYSDKGGLAAVYPTPPKKKGVILLKDTPVWLSDVVQGYVYGRASEGVQPRAPIGTGADHKDVGEERDPPRDPNDNMEKFRDVIHRFAQHWYILEQLKGRVGELAGRLRFDVCPGTQVKVESGGDVNIADDGLAQPFYASVSKVTHLINSEVQRAGTSFTLAHIRNEAENEDPDTSVAIPPLYDEAWNGKVLIDGVNPGK